ncbi:MAG TPA: ROK family protein, partial [Aggregatilineaceae bacterium]|nr:ROK family protein [Aggregatilineaceae bacterium]
CAVGNGSGQVLARDRISTSTPAETMQQIITFFKQQETLLGEPLTALGIGSFGPVDLDTASATYGYITRTPKPGWAFTDVVGPVRQGLGVPVAFDTDVNAAALGEHRWGAAQAWNTFIYMTVGTGIGGGGMVRGRLLHGLIHPEMGHILLPMRGDDPLQRGVCPFHPNCLEGLASGPSLQTRWDVPGEALPLDYPAWDLEAYYLAHALVDIMCTLSPQGIILGGSVMHQQQLFPLIRRKVHALLNDYLVHPRLETLDDYIVPPALGDDAGVKGALALAMAALGGE